MRSLARILVSALYLGLAGCGTYVPPLQEYTEGDAAAGRIVSSILLNITCEVQDALYNLIEEDKQDLREGRSDHRLTDWLEKWGVQLALSLQIDEKGSVDVNATGLPPSPASAVLSLTGGLAAASTATRVDKLHAFHAVKYLARQKCSPGARPGGLYMMQSDLKFKEWLKINLMSDLSGYVTYPTRADGPFKQDVISHQIKFIIDTSGRFSPGWKLTRVLVNQGNNFLSASRTRTHDLTITLGPLDKEQLKAGRIAPSRAAENAALASDIGISVANNLRADSFRAFPSIPFQFAP